METEGPNNLEHPEIIPQPKNLRKKFLCELSQGSFTAP